MSAPRERCLRTIQLQQAISSAEWSPDGTSIAVGCAGGTLVLVSVDGRTIWQCRHHSATINRVAWSPDGQRIVSASEDRSGRIVGAANGEQLLQFDDAGGFKDIAWSPDGRQIVYSPFFQYLVRVVDAATGQRLHAFDAPPKRDAWGVCWSPDSRRIAVADNINFVRIWDVGRETCLRTLEGHRNVVYKVSWSPNSRWIASASWDQSARIWDAESGECVHHWFIQRGWVRQVSWSADSRLVAAANVQNAVRIWSMEERRVILALDGHTVDVYSVDFSPSGAMLASAGYDQTVRIWDTSDLVKPVSTLRASSPEAISYVNRQAATVGRRGGDGIADLWVPPSKNSAGPCLLHFALSSGGLEASVAVMPDSRSVMFGSCQGRVLRWDLVTEQISWEGREKHDGSILDTALSPDGRVTATGGRGQIRLWDTASGTLIRGLGETSNHTMHLEWSPDGRYLAAGGNSGIVTIWEPVAGTSWKTIQSPGSSIWGLAWSPDGRLIAMGTGQGTLAIHDLVSNTELRRRTDLGGWVGDIGWSPDGRLFAISCYNRGEVIVENVERNYEQIHRLPHGGKALSLAWSPSGRYLATGSGQDTNRTIYIWDMQSGRQVKQFTFEERNAWRLAWARGGQFLASSHLGDACRIWDTRDLVSDRRVMPSIGVTKGAVPRELRPLTSELTRLHQLRQHPPLSLMNDLLGLLGGERDAGPLRPLVSHSGIQQLVGLRWPRAARLGLVAILLHQIPIQCWEPPASLTAHDLRADLRLALAGDSIPPEAPPAPVSALLVSADRIDDRLVTLLTLLGPDAVAADPALPLRLLPRVRSLPPLTVAQRDLLTRGAGLTEAGAALAGGGGAERFGIDSRGDWRSVLPSQWALPSDVLAYRQQMGGLLYRARPRRPMPKTRPLVVVLDVSPPCFGAVESVTRMAAHIAIGGCLQSGLPAVLLACAQDERVFEMNTAADVIDLWTARDLGQPNVARIMRLASRFREGLRGTAAEPIVVLLSHSLFGSDEDDVPQVSGLRGVFVPFPGHRQRPPLGSRCARWELVSPSAITDLPMILARLFE